MLIQGMHGLGDGIYQRAVVREVQGPVFLETPWPQLYSDLPVRCVRPMTKLRTQAKNARRDDLQWSRVPYGAQRMRLHYVNQPGSILGALARGLRVTPRVFDLPAFPAPTRDPYIVVRPATLRSEWRADSRNPHLGYIDRAAQALRDRYRIISVADLRDGEEWPSEPLPYADERYHAGELQLEQLLGLVAGAAGVVGGVGWLVPAAIAYRVPLLLLFGGWGLHNGPARIFSAPMDLSQVHQALPDRFCLCGNRSHDCDKRISDLDQHIERFAVRLAAGRSAALAA